MAFSFFWGGVAVFNIAVQAGGGGYLGKYSGNPGSGAGGGEEGEEGDVEQGQGNHFTVLRIFSVNISVQTRS